MLATSTAAIMMLASPASADVGYEILVEGRNNAAVEQLQPEGDMPKGDPAKLINLGVAYARLGRFAEARALFRAVMWKAERLTLETAEGKWKDSRHLARQAIKMLDKGDFRSAQIAVR